MKCDQCWLMGGGVADRSRRSRRFLGLVALAALAMSVAIPPAGAEEPRTRVPLLAAAAEAGPAATTGESAGGGSDIRWSFSGEARFRPEWRDNRDLDDTVDDDLRQGFMRLRLGIEAAHRAGYRLFFQAQDSRVAGEEASTASNDKNLDLHQGFVEIQQVGTERISLKAGRQEMKYGDERLIGAFGWNNVGRSFDAVKARYSAEPFWVDAFMARLSSRTAGGATTGGDLFGLYAQWRVRKAGEYEAYWLLRDDNALTLGERGGSGRTSIHAFGARVKERVGPVDVSVEAALERGEIAAEDLSAMAGAVSAAIALGERPNVRILAGYDYATGDEDPADGEREEFFDFFPTNHLHYGYMDYAGWRNLRSPWGGASWTAGRHTATLKAHRLALDSARGPWRDAGGGIMGFDPAGRSGRSLGWEADLIYRLAWREKGAFELGCGLFDPGRFARLTRGPDRSRWAYASLTFGF